MSIRLIAKELYRLQREVEKLEAEIEAAPFHEQEVLKERLRKVRSEWRRVRRILDGEKIPSPFRYRR